MRRSKYLLGLALYFAVQGAQAENFQGQDNIERVLASPSSEVEFNTAVELKKMQALADTPNQEAINAARPVCYSALVGNNNHSLIMVPLPSNTSDLDSVCHISINSGWHAGGIAKSNYFTQNCSTLDNTLYGGGYTSYVTETYFESNRSKYSSCNSTNSFVCCSPQFPN
ncbi:hypothetical protein [Agarilytica rhodophyticola]|uniref:hypothetical protein n=1 Tax=Agarilytica rhodophyticola TaxID=1737490 RepID=UPI000B3466C7|nr:hypothetical protein [Agarilytica rhodophyticola]